MPRYYFHLCVGVSLEPDRTGLILSDAYSAYLEAVRAIPDLAGELLAAGHDPTYCRFAITDRKGRCLFEVPFSEPARAANLQRPKPVRGARPPTAR